MVYANIADRNAIENEMPWDARELPKTTYAMLSQTAAKCGTRNAVTYHLMRRRPY